MKIISHRGNNISKYKGNSLEALLIALNLKYIDGIELDVRMTKDKKIVIIHDPIIDFVSNGSGLAKLMKYHELLKYNFGSEKYPTKIATLNELLANINTNKIIVIEIKNDSNNYKDICHKVYKILNKYKLNIYICSFNYKLIEYMSTLYNQCGVLIGGGKNITKLVNNFAFNIVNYQYRNKVLKKETFLWTINERKNDLDKYNVITDKPYLFVQK